MLLYVTTEKMNQINEKKQYGVESPKNNLRKVINPQVETVSRFSQERFMANDERLFKKRRFVYNREDWGNEGEDWEYDGWEYGVMEDGEVLREGWVPCDE